MSTSESPANESTWETFNARRERISSLIGRVQRLPAKVTHQTMVRVGGAGFIPGNLVHTNEFRIVKTENLNGEEIQKQVLSSPRISYADVVVELEARHGVVLKLVNSMRASKGLPPIGLPTVDEDAEIVSVTPKSSAPKTPANKPTKSASQKTSAPANTTKAVSKSDASTPVPLEPVFEIREYVDDSGVPKSEVVDISRQLAMMEKLSAEATEGGGGGGDALFSDEDAFIRELANIREGIAAGKRAQGIVDGEDLEEDGNDSLPSLEEVFKKLEEPSAKKKSSGGGWKAGFLGGGEKKSTQEVPKPPSSTSSNFSPPVVDEGKLKKSGVVFSDNLESGAADDTEFDATNQPPKSILRASSDIPAVPTNASRPMGTVVTERATPVVRPMGSIVTERTTPAVRPMGSVVSERKAVAPKPLAVGLQRRAVPLQQNKVILPPDA